MCKPTPIYTAKYTPKKSGQKEEKEKKNHLNFNGCVFLF